MILKTTDHALKRIQKRASKYSLEFVLNTFSFALKKWKYKLWNKPWVWKITYKWFKFIFSLDTFRLITFINYE